MFTSAIATRFYRLGSDDNAAGPAYITGTILIEYIHGAPPITDFAVDRPHSYRGPPCTLILEPDGKPGEFVLLNVYGRHVDDGLSIKGASFDLLVRCSALLRLQIVKSKVTSIHFECA